MRMSTAFSSVLMMLTNSLMEDIKLISSCLNTTFVFPVSWMIRLLATSPFSRFLQAKIILPFLLAKSRAVSNPTPVLAPVTMTVLPLSDLLLLNLNLLFEKPILETVPPMSFHSGLFLEYQINLAIKYIINILKSLFLWNSHASFLSYIK